MNNLKCGKSSKNSREIMKIYSSRLNNMREIEKLHFLIEVKTYSWFNYYIENYIALREELEILKEEMLIKEEEL